MHKALALIPARAGSKRVPDKNIRLLDGHPLLAYSIQCAIKSGVFERVLCATDNPYYADIATHYGAEVPVLRPATISGDKSPDIEWITWVLGELKNQGEEYDIFSILRPTSPFRRASTIQRAWKKFTEHRVADSLRAVEKCGQHPGKMWVLNDSDMKPIMPFYNEGVPWHSSQYAALPTIYVQNASLEIAWTRNVFEKNSISGDVVMPFITEHFEGFDINDIFDWWAAERIIENGLSQLEPMGLPFSV